MEIKYETFFNNVVAVTGRSSGIGKAVVQSFCEQGAKVAILGRDPIKLRKIINEFADKVVIVQGDIPNLLIWISFIKNNGCL